MLEGLPISVSCVLGTVFERTAGKVWLVRSLMVFIDARRASRMAGVILERVSRIFPGPVAALRDVTLEVRDGELLALVGPSGSGKTTLLRLVAGLEQPTQGEIRIGGRSVNKVPARQRDVALVFQSYALYPHLSVARNLALALELRRGWWSRQVSRLLASAKARQEHEEIDRRVQETARMLGIEELLARRPGELSGGQRQRVALGRALVRRPAVYLLDEPLSNVDARLRIELRRELKQLHRELAATMIYVTHDQEEALALGDRVAVLAQGRIEQVGAAEELYDRPGNRFVAEFLGVPETNFVAGSLAAVDGQVQFVGSGWSVALDKTTAAQVQRYLARPVVLALRPEDVRIEPSAGGTGGVPGRVVEVQPLAGVALVRVGERRGVSPPCETAEAASSTASVTLVSRTSARARMAAGDLVSMHLDMRQANVFDPQTGENIGWPQVVEGN
jgi:multiple sugar transport system ATP-binding protein